MRIYTFEVEDKSYSLKYNYNAICDFEDLCGKPIQEIFNGSSFGVSYARNMLLAGLKWKIAGITKQQVGFICDKLIEEDRLEEVFENASSLLEESVGSKKGAKDESVGE